MNSNSVTELVSKIDDELRGILSARQMPLYDMMQHHLALGDGPPTAPAHRSRGVLCLLACGESDVAMPAAAAVELVQGFTEIHDDVQGGIPTRDGRDAVWWVWGPAQAINAGDGMHGLGRLAMFRLIELGVDAVTTFEGLRILDQAALSLCEGRYADLEAQERINFSVENYLAMVADKTGALYAGALKLGGLLAEAEPGTIELLGDYGRRAGALIQVSIDLSELAAGAEGPGHEVMNKKKLLPVSYAMERAAVRDKRRIGDIYFKRVLEPQDVAALRDILEELGAFEYCESYIDSELDELSRAAEGLGGPVPGYAAVHAFVTELVRG